MTVVINGVTHKKAALMYRIKGGPVIDVQFSDLQLSTKKGDTTTFDDHESIAVTPHYGSYLVIAGRTKLLGLLKADQQGNTSRPLKVTLVSKHAFLHTKVPEVLSSEETSAGVSQLKNAWQSVHGNRKTAK